MDTPITWMGLAFCAGLNLQMLFSSLLELPPDGAVAAYVCCMYLCKLQQCGLARMGCLYYGFCFFCGGWRYTVISAFCFVVSNGNRQIKKEFLAVVCFVLFGSFHLRGVRDVGER